MSQRLTQPPEGQRPVLVESAPTGSRTAPAAHGAVAGHAQAISKARAKARSIGRRKGEVAGAAAIAEHAKAELASITSLDVDHVSAVVQEPDGWHVTVDLVELRRIPASTDVLAAYEAVLGPTGILMSYHRKRRYFRDQMMEES